MRDSILPTGDVHDFDFLYGDWAVSNRRLRRRLAGCDAWDEFAGVSRCEPRLGGAANVDEIRFPTEGHSGMALRLFDAGARRWSIHWASSRGAVLLPPVYGGFAGDRGTFYGDDVDEGRPVRVEFVWARLGPDRARWEQSFSLDGDTWELNWVMDFVRAPG